MISGLAFAYVGAPCIGATVMAAVLRDWRLVAAAASGALAFLFASDSLPDAIRLFGTPLVMGVLIGALFLTGRLATRPTSDIWSRMLWAMVPTFFVTFLFLLITTSGV